ncbi:hypothetical protein EJF90_04665 [Neisseria meningitidis]|nr:hypothetical protein [Neisseria meningitidis]
MITPGYVLWIVCLGVLPALAGIQNVKSKETVFPDKFLCRQT